jgi:hypothetical protein
MKDLVGLLSNPPTDTFVDTEDQTQRDPVTRHIDILYQTSKPQKLDTRTLPVPSLGVVPAKETPPTVA